MSFELSETLQVVRRGKDVHVRERHAHPLADGLVAGAAQQRIQPDHPAGAGVEFAHGVVEHVDVAGIPPVADHNDHGARREHQATVPGEECPQALPNFRPARPVGHSAGDLIQRRAQVGF